MGDPVSHITEAECENNDTDEEGILKLLEDKRCAICHEVVVNACRVSCGHSYCRPCIDTQLDETNLEGRNQRCVICDAKIDEVQNCPELDKEINTLFSRLSSKKQLDRAGVKADKKRAEDDKRNAPNIPRIDLPGNRNSAEPLNEAHNREPSTSYVNQGHVHCQREQRHNSNENRNWYGTEEIPSPVDDGIVYFCPHSPLATQNIVSENQNDDSFHEEVDDSNDGTTPPVLVHETFTFHRTRVLNPRNNDLDENNRTSNQQTFQQQHQPQLPMMTPCYYNCPPQCNYAPQQYCNYRPYHPCNIPPQCPFVPYQSFPSQYQSGQHQPYINNLCGPMFPNYDNFTSCPYNYAYDYNEQDNSPQSGQNFMPHSQDEFIYQNGWNSHEAYGRDDAGPADAEPEEISPDERLNFHINLNLEMPNGSAETTAAENTDDSDSESDSEFHTGEFIPRQDIPFPVHQNWDDSEFELIGIFRLD